MPLPKPRPRENEDDWMGRCMANPTMRLEYPDTNQRLAVCGSLWRNRNKETGMSSLNIGVPDHEAPFPEEAWGFEDQETKVLDLEAELKAEDDQTGTFRGRASTFGNMDLTRDIIEPGAFSKSLHRRGPKRVKMLFSHDVREPIGIWEDMEETDRDLRVKGRLLINQGVPTADKVFSLMKAGALDALSIGFVTKDAEFDEDKRIRRIKEIDLFEVSVVTFPANERARITGVKTIVPFQDMALADRSRPWDRARAERRVRGFTDSEDQPSRRYRQAFVWYDRENPEEFDSYKLQIADVIDGRLVVVPRAVFAAAAVIQGARGGVEIPEQDRVSVRRHLTRYYSKMREMWEDDSLAAPWEQRDASRAFSSMLSSMADLIESEKDMEGFLRDAGFSRREAKAVMAGSFNQVVSPLCDADGDLEALVASLKNATSKLRGE